MTAVKGLSISGPKRTRGGLRSARVSGTSEDDS